MTSAITAEALHEADIAGADAAREARAEVLERATARVAGRGAEISQSGANAAKAKGQDPYHRFTIDVWITNLNSVEFGFYRRSRNKAKSRQFTSDMDIFAEVIEKGERTGLLGYREDLWTKNTGLDKRLVFKLFGEKLNWRATMDLMLGRSLQLTIGAGGLPVTAFSINTNDHEQVVYLERSANHWRGFPEHFSFCLIEDGRIRFFRLKQILLSIGMDYSVHDEAGRQIGFLDGRLFSLGGLWKCRVLAKYADARLLTVLKLFAGMLVFNKGCRRHVKHLAREVAAGRVTPKLERQETDLYLNPRRVR